MPFYAVTNAIVMSHDHGKWSHNAALACCCCCCCCCHRLASRGRSVTTTDSTSPEVRRW